MIEYDHTRNVHGLDGPRAAFTAIFTERPQSFLDVGCGTGTWLRAALDEGVKDVAGIDGVRLSDELLVVPKQHVLVQDLTKGWNLNRKFDAVVCLEVAEHLDKSHARTLVAALVQHGDLIVFSAACPEQSGEHHVNCQWPAYWQKMFNDFGYVCDDAVRWRIWDDSRIEPWYRQNLFIARRDPNLAGKERRLPAVLHPLIHTTIVNQAVAAPFSEHIAAIADGKMNVGWYALVPFQAVARKARRWAMRKLRLRASKAEL
jgi:SAM-dependent methyltransferase